MGESNSFHLIRIRPVWPNIVRRILLNFFWLQIKLLPLSLLVVLGYLIFFLLAPDSGGALFFDSASEINNDFDVLLRVLVGLLSVNLFSPITWMARSLTEKGMDGFS